MDKVKKLPKNMSSFTPMVEAVVDEIEARGHEIIRIRTRVKPSKSNTITGVEGFEGYSVEPGSRVRKLMPCKTKLFPSTDGHMYGYIPATKGNLERLEHVFGNKRYVVDDVDFYDQILERVKERSLPTEFVPKSREVEISEEDKKLNELANLRKQLELKRYDEEIAALKAELGDSYIDQKEEAPKQGRSLQGKRITRGN